MQCVEENLIEYYKTAIAFKQDTALGTLRPCIKFLGIVMGKLNVPYATAFQEELSLATESENEFAVWAIHFVQLLLSYMFCDYDTAAKEAKALEHYMKVHLHPGFSGILTLYCLSLLAVAPRQRGLARWRLLSSVKQNMKKLKNFSEYVPDNCLHKLHFVQAELALVQGNDKLARSNYESTISLAAEVDVSWMCGLASERFAQFLRDQGDEAGALCKFQEAHSAYIEWGATAKAHQLERSRMPKRASVTTETETVESMDFMQ